MAASFALAAAAAAGAAAGEPPLKLPDPAPPAHRPLPADAAAPPARAHPRAVVHAAPRPLPEGFAAEDWPCFLGPRRSGVSMEGPLRRDFGPPGEPNAFRPIWELRWGAGFSAPSVVARRLVAFHRDGNDEVAECLEADAARQLWRRRYPTTYRDRFGYNGGPRASPAIEGGRVFTYGAQGVLTCLDLRTGHVYWGRELLREFGGNEGFFGAATSPVVVGGLVVVNVGGRDGPCVAAFDKTTGRLRWAAGDKWGAGCATPLPVRIAGRDVLLVFAGGYSRPPVGGLLGIDAADGTVLFRFPWRSRNVASVNASSPVFDGNCVMVSSVYGPGALAVRVRDDLSAEAAWKTNRFGSHWMTPILRDGYVYGFTEDVLMCLDWKTGRRVWSSRPAGPRVEEPNAPAAEIAQPRGRFGRGSLLLVRDRFLCLGDTGWLAWMDLTPRGVTVGPAVQLFDARMTYTAPVLSRGLLYVVQSMPERAGGKPARLLCYDLRPLGGTSPRR